MQPLSKGFYLGSIIGAMVLYVLLMGIGAIAAQEQEEAGMPFVCIGFLFLIYGVVIICVLLYKMWDAIQDGPARTTPGKAVGFMFIPLFNLYWMFQAWWGWTKDYNAYAEMKGLPLPRMPEGIALAMCILTLCGFVPLVNIFAGLANIVLMIVFYNAGINGVNAIAEVELGGDMGMGAEPGEPGDVPPPPAPPLP